MVALFWWPKISRSEPTISLQSQRGAPRTAPSLHELPGVDEIEPLEQNSRPTDRTEQQRQAVKGTLSFSRKGPTSAGCRADTERSARPLVDEEKGAERPRVRWRAGGRRQGQRQLGPRGKQARDGRREEGQVPAAGSTAAASTARARATARNRIDSERTRRRRRPPFPSVAAPPPGLLRWPPCRRHPPPRSSHPLLTARTARSQGSGELRRLSSEAPKSRLKFHELVTAESQAQVQSDSPSVEMQLHTDVAMTELGVSRNDVETVASHEAKVAGSNELEVAGSNELEVAEEPETCIEPVVIDSHEPISLPPSGEIDDSDDESSDEATYDLDYLCHDPGKRGYIAMGPCQPRGLGTPKFQLLRPSLLWFGRKKALAAGLGGGAGHQNTTASPVAPMRLAAR
ncbi:hypothetical protein EJB05_14514, partial [Eragrostis curvula]